MKKINIFYFLLLLIIFACNKEEIQTVDLSDPQVTEDGRVILKWSTSNIKGFKYYRIMRAEKNGQFKTINDISNQSSNAFKEDSISYTDSSYPITSDSVYYKVIVFGDEITSSRNVRTRVPKPLEISYNTSIWKVIPEQSYLLLYSENYSNSQMYVYNYLTSKIVGTIDLPHNYSSATIALGKYNGKYEIYFYDGYGILKIIDVNSAQEVGNVSMSYSYPYFSTDNNGHIFFNSGYYLYTIDRSTLKISQKSLNYYYNYGFYTSNNKYLGYYYSRIGLYSLNNDTPTLEYLKENISAGSNPTYLPINNLLFWEKSGTTALSKIDNWSEIVLKDELGNRPVFYKICESSTNICAIYSGNVAYCYNNTDFSLIKKINLKFNSQNIATDGTFLFYTGNYNGKYYLDKVKL